MIIIDSRFRFHLIKTNLIANFTDDVSFPVAPSLNASPVSKLETREKNN